MPQIPQNAAPIITRNIPFLLLVHVNGTNKGVVFEIIEMGAVCAIGGASHPRGAAAAALKDVINLYRETT